MHFLISKIEFSGNVQEVIICIWQNSYEKSQFVVLEQITKHSASKALYIRNGLMIKKKKIELRIPRLFLVSVTCHVNLSLSKLTG